jgi:hypothetical protein
MKSFLDMKQRAQQMKQEQELLPLQKALMGAETEYLGRKDQGVTPTEQIGRMKVQRLQELQAKEAEGTITDSERTTLNRMLGGGALVDIKMPEPASAAERESIAKGRAAVDSLDNLKMLFDSAKTRTGPAVGRIDPVAGLVGWTSPQQEAFMAATASFKNQIIKEITGAQMSELEAKRILSEVPMMTDPPERWLAKWEQTRRNRMVIAQEREKVLRQSGMVVPEDTSESSIDSSPDYTDVELKTAIGMAKRRLSSNATDEEILDAAMSILRQHSGRLTRGASPNGSKN